MDAAAWEKGGGRYCPESESGGRLSSAVRLSQLSHSKHQLEAPVTDHDAIPVPVFQGIQSRVRTAYSIFIKGVLLG
jgi:hypothetical protein